MKILLSKNGTLTDLTTILDDYKNGSSEIEINHTQDAIFIGAIHPFNSKFFKIKTPAVSSLLPKIEYWTGSSDWKEAIELIDETEGLTKSGFITIVPNKDHGWIREDTNRIAALYSKVIYDLFWMKISFGASDTVELSWVGELFSNDDDLSNEFPDLLRSQTLDSFETGKTNWEAQHVIAAKLIIDDLRSKKIIDYKEQLLDRKEFTLASVQKCASIIYSSFGDDYLNNKRECDIEYKKRISKDIFNIDRNQSAQVNTQSITQRQTRLSR